MRFPLIVPALLLSAAVRAQPILLLDAEAAAPDAVSLKLVILPTTDAPIAEAHLRLLADGQAVNETSAIVPPARAGGDARIARFDALPLPPGRTEVEGRVDAGRWQSLGALTSGADGPRLDRPSAPAQGEVPVTTVAACECLGNRRLTVRIGFFSGGATFDRNLSAFLHFEPAPTGEDHRTLAPLGLYPAARPTDSAYWASDEVTVVTFGPYAIPSEAALPIYVAVGMYDQYGTGERARLLGSDETSRVVVGRIVERDGDIAFERLAPPEGGDR